MARLLLSLLALTFAASALAPVDQSHSQTVVLKRFDQPGPTAADKQNLERETPSTGQSSVHGHVFATDTSVKTHTLSNRDIDALMEQGELRIELPGHSTLALTLTQVSQRADIQHLSLRSAQGFPSTISRRGDRFSASLATRTGTFKLRGNTIQTLLISNDELDWRLIPGLADSRRPV